MDLAFKKFKLLIKSTIPWTIAYFIIGGLFIYFGIQIEGYKVLSNTLISIGGSILAIGLVTIWVEVSSSWRVLQILHMYGDFKSHGIYRVFPNSDDVEYQELYREARKNPTVVKILSLIGRKFIENDDRIKKTLEMIKKAKYFTINSIAKEKRLGQITSGKRYTRSYIEETCSSRV